MLYTLKNYIRIKLLNAIGRYTLAPLRITEMNKMLCLLPLLQNAYVHCGQQYDILPISN